MHEVDNELKSFEVKYLLKYLESQRVCLEHYEKYGKESYKVLWKGSMQLRKKI